MTITSFTVKRATWRRGNIGSKLYVSGECTMCCLGFLGLACGLTQEEMKDISSPAETIRYKLFPQNLIAENAENVWDPTKRNSNICEDIMLDNDSRIINDVEREQKLKKLFAKINIEIIFED